MESDISVEMLKSMYRTMVIIRLFEESAGKLYQKGLVKGGIHASIGQEAVAVGVCSTLRREDWITSTHRGHGHHIAKGANLNNLMAEILGKSTGCCRGRGGSMHVAEFDIGSLGAYSIVGSGIPIGVGAALTSSMRGLDRVVVAFFGDGALGQGILLESLNMAVLWKLPIIFLCENNQIAVSTKNADSFAVKTHTNLFATFDIPSIQLNGQDPLCVYKGVLPCVELARSGGGPSFIECNTFRFEGHYFGEPQVYRSREEVENERQNRDPIIMFAHFLCSSYGIDKEDLHNLESEAKHLVNDAVDFALNSPDPSPETYKEYIYA